MRFARDIYNAIYSPVHQLAMIDISKDEIDMDKGFETRRMLSDANLSPEVANDPNMRQYTGKFDMIAALRAKTPEDYPYLNHGKSRQVA